MPIITLSKRAKIGKYQAVWDTTPRFPNDPKIEQGDRHGNYRCLAGRSLPRYIIYENLTLRCCCNRLLSIWCGGPSQIKDGHRATITDNPFAVLAEFLSDQYLDILFS